MDTNIVKSEKSLTSEEKRMLEMQNTRLVSDYKAKMLEIEAKRHWDLFYKRNENRFFKDRHWTTREFVELLASDSYCDRKVLLEIGCGVGNLVYPLIEMHRNFFVYACDLSPRAVSLVKANKLYNENVIVAFQTDITTNEVESVVAEESVDIITLIFVLSAIHPNKFGIVLKRCCKLLKPGGILLFRDYGLHDMAQIRFKPGHKISDNFYMRQDGTRTYYFSRDEVTNLFEGVGFDVISNEYVHRRTINKKEELNVPRIFVQAKIQKKEDTVSIPRE